MRQRGTVAAYVTCDSDRTSDRRPYAENELAKFDFLDQRVTMNHHASTWKQIAVFLQWINSQF
jgi:hypothetical protein